MYFLVRNNYCVCVNNDLNKLKEKMQEGDVVKEVSEEKRADEIFTLDGENNLVKK